jgi:prepilin-type N-terminal cleavage/methylation domain-containing protein
MRRLRFQACRGITLLELLIVVAVIAVLVFIALPTLRPSQEESSIEVAKTGLLYLHAQEQQYFNVHGTYTSLKQLGQDPQLGPGFDPRYAAENPVVDGITYRGPDGDGPIYDIIATLPDGSRYKVDQTGKVMPLQ